MSIREIFFTEHIRHFAGSLASLFSGESIRRGLGLLVVFVCGVFYSYSDKYWTGAFSQSWNDTRNWSDTAGGAGGAAVPGRDENIFVPAGCTYWPVYDDSVAESRFGKLEIAAGARFVSSSIFTVSDINCAGTFRIDDSTDFELNNTSDVYIYNFELATGAHFEFYASSDHFVTIENLDAGLGSDFECAGSFKFLGDVNCNYFSLEDDTDVVFVNGNIDATDSVCLYGKLTVDGNIRTPVVRIATENANLIMGNPGSTITVSDEWKQEGGKFTANGSKVIFTSAQAKITGYSGYAVEFYDLDVSACTTSFTSNSDIKVLNSFVASTGKNVFRKSADFSGCNSANVNFGSGNFDFFNSDLTSQSSEITCKLPDGIVLPNTFIGGNVRLELAGNASAVQFWVPDSGHGYDYTGSFNACVSGPGTLTVTNKFDIGRSSSVPDVRGVCEIDTNVVLNCASGNSQSHVGSSLVINSGKVFDAPNDYYVSSYSIVPAISIEVRGTLNTRLFDLGRNNTACAQLKIASGGTLTAREIQWETPQYTAADTTPFVNDGNVTVRNFLRVIKENTAGTELPLINNGTITVSAAGDVSASKITGSGSIIFGSTGSLKSLSQTETSSLGTVESTGALVCSGNMTVDSVDARAGLEIIDGKFTAGSSFKVTGTFLLNDAEAAGRPPVEFDANGCAIDVDGDIQLTKGTFIQNGSDVTVTKGSGSGNFEISADSSAVMNGIIVCEGAITLGGDSSADGDVVFNADEINIDAALDATDHVVTFYPKTATMPLVFGTAVPGSMSLTNDELTKISAKTFVLGDGSNTGGLTINQTMSVNAGIHLITGGAITQTVGGAYTINSIAGELRLQGASGIGNIAGDAPVTIGSVSDTVSAQITGTGDIFLKINNSATTKLGGAGGKLFITPNGNIKIETVGSIEVGGDIEATSGTLALKSETGAITRADGTLKSSTTLTLDAYSGLGSAALLMDVDCADIKASTSNGGIYLSQNGTFSVQNAGDISSNGSDVLLKAQTFNLAAGSVVCGSGNINLTSYIVASELSVAQSQIGGIVSTGKLTLGDSSHTGNIKFSGAMDVSGFEQTVISGSSISSDSDSATFTGKTAIVPVGAQMTLNGSFGFDELEALGLGGKTLVFEAGKTQTVNGKLTLKGNSAASLLKLRSSAPQTQWNVKCTSVSDISDIQFVDVEDSNNISVYELDAKIDSKDSGNNDNWHFPGQVYTWTGESVSTPNKWKDKANWSPKTVPSKDSVISIPDVSASSNEYPVLDEAIAVGTGTLTIDAGAQIDFVSFNFTADRITNNGLVKIEGGNTLTATRSNGTDPDSTVEYYGNLGTDLPWGDSYTKLVFSSGADVTYASPVTVSGTTQIYNGTGNKISLASASSFTGLVSIGNAALSKTGGQIRLNSASSITLADGAECDSLEIVSDTTVQNVKTSGNQVYGGKVTLADGAVLEAAIIVLNGSDFAVPAGKQVEFKGAVTLGNNVAFAGNGSVAVFDSTLGGGVTARSATFSGFDLELNGNAGGSTNLLSSITVSGHSLLNCDFVETTGPQTYTGNVIFSKPLSLTACDSTSGSDVYSDVVFGGNVTGAYDLELNAPVKLLVTEHVFDLSDSINTVYKTVKFNQGLAADAILTLKANAEIKSSNDFSQLKVLNDEIGASTSVKFEGGSTQTIKNAASASDVYFAGNSQTDHLLITSLDGNSWYTVFADKPVSENFAFVLIENSFSVDSTGAKNDLKIVPSLTNVCDTDNSAYTTKYWFAYDFYWVGTVDTRWTSVGNWAYDAAGTVASLGYPNFDEGTSDITIAFKNTHELILENDVKLNTLQVNENAELDLVGFKVDLTESSGALLNNGKIRLEGSQTVSAGGVDIALGTMSDAVTNGATSTVEYYGACGSGLGLGYAYQNIEFTDGASGNITLAVSVLGTTTITNGSSNALSLIGGNTFTGVVTAGNSTDAAGNLVLNSASGFTLSGGANASSLEIQSNVHLDGNVDSTTTQIYRKELVANNATTLTGTEISLGSAGENNSISGEKVTFNTDSIKFLSDLETVSAPVVFDKTLKVTGKQMNFDAAVSANWNLDFDVENANINQDFTQPYFDAVNGTFTEFKISSGNINVSNKKFEAGQLMISFGTAFVQTGANSVYDESQAGTVADRHLVAGIVNDGFCSWDNVAQGGTLELFGSVTGNNGKETLYNLKNVLIRDEIEISGIFYDLLVPGGIKITNGSGIIVRRNLTVKTGGEYLPNGQTLFLGKYVASFGTVFDSFDGTITDGSGKSFGTVSVDQDSTRKTFATDFLCDSIVFDSADTDTQIVFDSNDPLKDFVKFKVDSDYTVPCRIVLNSNAVLEGMVHAITLNGNVETDVASPKAIQFSGSMTDLKLNAPVLVETYFAGSAVVSSSVNVGSGVIEKDVFVSGTSVQFDAPVTIKGNLALFNGAVAQNADLTVSKDIIFLNGTAAGLYADPDSGIADLFAYHHWGRSGKTAAPSLASFPVLLPDSSSISHSSYSSTFVPKPGIIVKAGQNFYDNGVDLTSTGNWNLNIKDNSKATDSFAEVYNAEISYCQSNHALSAAENCVDQLNNLNVFFSRPEILVDATYTVFDDVIRIEFIDSITSAPIKIENSNDEIKKAVSSINHSDSPYEGTYIDPDCTTSTDGQDDLSVFYLKSNQTWNTDATGSSAGDGQSTDRGGTHRNLIPYVEIPKALSSVYETLRDEHKNRISTVKFQQVTDHAKPVLIAAYSGQELYSQHDGSLASSQPEYDSHNFVEFQYSEAVDIGSMAYDAGDVNLRSTEYDSSNPLKFGGHIPNSDSGLTVSGFASISSGKLYSGVRSDGSSGSPHALYRNFPLKAGDAAVAQTHRIRVSVAGFVEGTVTAQNVLSTATYNNWIGYIDSSMTPSGTVTPLENIFILDLAEDSTSARLNNVFDHAGTAVHTLPAISLNSHWTPSSNEIWGEWDCSAPEFAPYVRDEEDWRKWRTDTGNGVYELVGAVNSDASAFLDNLEFHLYDNNHKNRPSYSWWWRSRYGWKTSGSDNETDTDTNLPEKSGGAREGYNVLSGNRTTGGIRRSSLVLANDSFRYIIEGEAVEKQPGTTEILQNVKSRLFRGDDDEITANDGLYLVLPLNSSDVGRLPVKTTFKVNFDGNNSFITDLAGNRISQKLKMDSIDITPPSFVMNLAPIGEKIVYLIFSKQLQIPRDKETWCQQLNKSLKFVDSATMADSGIRIEKVEFIDDDAVFSELRLTLNKEITLTDIEKLWIYAEGDASNKVKNIFGQTVSNTYIEDGLNFLEHGKKHALSDFAINAVDVLYAYANQTDEDGWNEKGIYGTGTARSLSDDYAVHDFTQNAGNYGKLLAERDVTVQLQFAGERNGNSATKPENGETLSMVIDKKASLNNLWISDKINRQTGSQWRVWFDRTVDSVATGFNNSPLPEASEMISAGDDDGLLQNFMLKNEIYNFKAGDEVQFLFKVCDASGNPVLIDHDGDITTASIPLYALRMAKTDINKGIPFVDLWSFTLKNIRKQRGGATILNNVINVSVKEQTVLEVDMPSDGNLNVYVLTVDGNIVKQLHKGRISKGQHFFKWDGTNNKGNAVARGIYFIRIVGTDIDETRKVMCVK